MTSAEFPENMPRGAAAAEEQETTTEAGPSSQAAPSTSEATAAAAPAKKRRRPALSCEQCRRRKIRCDRNVPCSHCVKSGIGNGCHYIPTHTPASWLQGDKSKKGPGRKKKSTQDQDQSQVAQDARRPQQILPAPASGDEGNETVAQDQVAGNVDWLVTHIEERLSKVVTIDHGNGGPIPGHISILTPPSLSHSQQQSHTSSSDAADTPSSGRSVPPVCAGKCPVSRIKYLGRSHWMHGVGMVRACPRRCL